TAVPYMVVASVAGCTDYISANSSPVTFVIAKATPTVSVSDVGGTYRGSSFPASDTVTGISGLPTSSLEGVTPTLLYYVGSSVGRSEERRVGTEGRTYTVGAS